MIKRNRIYLYAVLIVCLLVLSACGKKQDPPANDPTQQSVPTQATNQAEQNTEQTDAPDATIPAQSEQVLNWENTYIYSHSVFAGLHFNGTRITEDIYQDVITADHSPDSDGQCKFCKDKYGTINYFYCSDRFNWKKHLSYTSEFFADHTLILVGIEKPTRIRMQDITDVTYSDGVLTILVTEYSCPGSSNAEAPGNDSVYSLVELDTVLPENATITVKYAEERLDAESFRAKVDAYIDRCILADDETALNYMK